MTDCTHCLKPLPSGLYLCNTGSDDLRRILARVQDTLSTAGGTLTNTAVAPPPEGGEGTSREAPGLPYSLDMSERVSTYRQRIGYWATQLGDHTGTPAPRDTIRAARFLEDRMPIIRGKECAGQILNELRTTERDVINAADRQAPRILLGTCGTLQWQDDAITTCDGTVIGREGDDQAKCGTCQTKHSARERVTAKIAQAWHAVAPLPQVLRALKTQGIHIKYDTAKSWAQRGKIGLVCHRETRAEGYALAAVLQATKKRTTP